MKVTVDLTALLEQGKISQGEFDRLRALMPAIVLPPWLFAVGWALALIATGIWATRASRRWVVNVAAVFGAIHFYTQWFDKLRPSPLAFLLGGLVMLAFALALWTFNRRSEALPA